MIAPITRRALAAGAWSAAGWSRARADVALSWITSPGHFYLAPYFATQTGIFAKQGIAMRMIIATSPPAMLAGVVGGSVQIGSSTAVQVAMARENGLDVGFLAASSVQWKGHPATGIVVRGDSDIREPKDFFGRKVVSPGTNGTFYLMFVRYLMDHGIDPTKVTMLEGGFGQMADLLRSRQVDAALLTEPFIFQLLDSGVGRRVEYFEMDAPYTYDAFYICTSSWAEANPDLVARVRDGLRQAMTGMQADPQRATAVEAESFKLSSEIIRRLGPPVFPIDLKPADLAVWLEIGRKLGLLQKNEDPAEMIIA